jgi:hypothetical protein
MQANNEVVLRRAGGARVIGLLDLRHGPGPTKIYQNRGPDICPDFLGNSCYLK